ncbi:MAG: glycosyl transferase family protein [Alphaproteobacteria bacterium]|nr:glycosyl transferase family protein [Alphaproteobacteria bacterium]
MSDEHPFATYIRILGKGPNLSRSLTEDESLAATRMLLSGQATPMQVGAFLCLLRVKTETPAEVAGIVRAARETLVRPSKAGAAELDWPTYAGKSRRLPWFLPAARLLADNGIRVLLHGDTGHAPDRVHVAALLDRLGIAQVHSVPEAESCLRERAIAYLPLESLQPGLCSLLGLRGELGVRSPLNTALRQLNPLAAPYQVIGVAHPGYRDVQRAAAGLLGQPAAAVFKGEGGEAERRPEKPCEVHFLRGGATSEETFPALLPGTTVVEERPLDPRRIAAVWMGTFDDPVASAAVIGTAAIALRLIGRADSSEAADALAAAWWRGRRRTGLAAA